MESKVLFGILGAPRSGKNVISEYLETKYGFKSIAFADLIKKEFGISKKDFEELKKTDHIEKVRKQLWDFSAVKKAINPMYFIDKTMDFAMSVDGPVVINDIRTPEELHAFFTHSLHLQKIRRIYLVERSGVETFDINDFLVESKLSHSLIEEYSKYYGYKNMPGVKIVYNNDVLTDFTGYLNEFFLKELKDIRV